MPPIDSGMLLIAGTACQRSRRSANHANSGCRAAPPAPRPRGSSSSSGPTPSDGISSGRTSKRPGGSGDRQPSASAWSVSADLAAVAADRPGRRAVPGVADQLVVDDARAGVAGPVGREHRDRGPDPAAAGGLAQVRDALVGDGRRGAHRPPVAHVQPVPVQPPDAACRVAPRHPGAERELRRGVGVGAGPVDLRPDLRAAGAAAGQAGLVSAWNCSRNSVRGLGSTDRSRRGRLERGTADRASGSRPPADHDVIRLLGVATRCLSRPGDRSSAPSLHVLPGYPFRCTSSR